MKFTTLIFGGLLILALAILAVWIYLRSFQPLGRDEGLGLPLVEARAQSYGITTVGMPTTPTVLTEAFSHDGVPAEVACVTCHTTRTPDRTNRREEDLDLFHQGLIVEHGGMSCLSCHNSENYDTLKLADGTAVGFEQTMLLCAQCHGPQTRDYTKGSHGGMTGYWDLTRGPRERNACTVCHDAHAPAYPQLMPVFAPKDIVPPEHPAYESH